MSVECAEYRERTGTEYGLWGGNMTKRRRRADAGNVPGDR